MLVVGQIQLLLYLPVKIWGEMMLSDCQDCQKQPISSAQSVLCGVCSSWCVWVCVPHSGWNTVECCSECHQEWLSPMLGFEPPDGSQGRTWQEVLRVVLAMAEIWRKVDYLSNFYLSEGSVNYLSPSAQLISAKELSDAGALVMMKGEDLHVHWCS